MAAVVGYVLDEKWTRPRITEMAVTSDGIVMVAQDGEVGLNHILGRAEDLDRNWEALVSCADLSPEEKAEARARFHERIRRWDQ